MSLVRVELLRLRSRRAAWFLALLAVVGVLLAVGASIRDSQPPGDAEVAQAEQQLERELENGFYERDVEMCEEAQAAGEVDSYPPDFDCDDLLPRIDWFLYHEPPRFVEQVRDLVGGSAVMLALAAALIGATFAGAEWSAGTIGTHLLFEPRRGRVYAAKAAALGIGLGLLAVVALAVVYAGTWFAASRWGSTALVVQEYVRQPDGSEIGVDRDLGWFGVSAYGLRALALVVAAALGGFALAMAFRSSLGAVGVVAGYAIAGEGLLRALWTGSEPWLLSSRLTAWILGGHDLYTYPDSCDFGSGPCEPVVTHLSTWDGGVYLVVLLAAGIAISAALFRRRDVT